MFYKSVRQQKQEARDRAAPISAGVQITTSITEASASESANPPSATAEPMSGIETTTSESEENRQVRDEPLSQHAKTEDPESSPEHSCHLQGEVEVMKKQLEHQAAEMAQSRADVKALTKQVQLLKDQAGQITQSRTEVESLTKQVQSLKHQAAEKAQSRTNMDSLKRLESQYQELSLKVQRNVNAVNNIQEDTALASRQSTCLPEFIMNLTSSHPLLEHAEAWRRGVRCCCRLCERGSRGGAALGAVMPGGIVVMEIDTVPERSESRHVVTVGCGGRVTSFEPADDFPR